MSSDDLDRLKEGPKKFIIGASLLTFAGAGNGYFVKRLVDEVDQIAHTVNLLAIQDERQTNSLERGVAALDKRVSLIEQSRADLVPRFLATEEKFRTNENAIDLIEVRLEMIEKRLAIRNIFPKRRK